MLLNTFSVSIEIIIFSFVKIANFTGLFSNVNSIFHSYRELTLALMYHLFFGTLARFYFLMFSLCFFASLIMCVCHLPFLLLFLIALR